MTVIVTVTVVTVTVELLCVELGFEVSRGSYYRFDDV